MTEIVRASLGLPTLRAGPQFQNPKPSHHLKKENFKYVLVIEYWNLRFICNLVLGIWDSGMRIADFRIRIMLYALCPMLYAFSNPKLAIYNLKSAMGLTLT